mgnify:CR=1 FL=1
MTLLSIDPGRSAKGEKSIGVALFSTDWELRGLRWGVDKRLSLTYEGLRASFDIRTEPWLVFMGVVIDEVVIENFVNNDRSRGGQTNGTSECIGMVETFCWLTSTPFIRQEPAALAPAKLHAPKGSFKDLKHLRHEDSAFLHGYEFLVRRGDIEVDLSATM